MKGQITYIVNLFLIAFIIYASIGVSVLVDETRFTIPEFIVELVIEDNLCCQIKVLDKIVEETTHCCCITELMFAQFYFNNTLVEKEKAPNFLTAFINKINAEEVDLKSYVNIVHYLEIPSPKNTQKNLSLLQVYRL